MALRRLIPNIDEIVRPLLEDPKSVAVDAFDGDGTVFKQDMESGNAWDMNPAEGAVAAATAFGEKGHFGLLISARDMSDLERSGFAGLRKMGLDANGGLEQIAFGEEVRKMKRAEFGELLDFIKKECREFVDVRYREMGHGFGAQCWSERHRSRGDFEVALKKGVDEGLVQDPEEREWKVVTVKEGVYVVPDYSPGKLVGMQQYVDKVEKKTGMTVKLLVARGNSNSDAGMVKEAGNRADGIGFWVGNEPGKPEGPNVIQVRDEDEMAKVWSEVVAMLPDRSGA